MVICFLVNRMFFNMFLIVVMVVIVVVIVVIDLFFEFINQVF